MAKVVDRPRGLDADAVAGALATAGAALATDDEEAALAALLVAWRGSRAVEIAALVEALGRRLEDAVPAITGARDTVHDAWMAIAAERRPADLPRLVRSIILTADRFGVEVVKALVARGASLADWPSDPRTGALVHALLATPRYEASSTSTQPFWRGLLGLAIEHADPRTADALATLRFKRLYRHFSDRSRAVAWFQTEVDAAVTTLRVLDSPAALPRSLATTVAKLAAAIAKRGPVSAAQRARLVRMPAVKPAPRARGRRAPEPSGSVLDHLGVATQALERRDEPAALVAILASWRATRAPELAALVDELSARLAAPLPAIEGTSRAAIHAAWLAIAKRRDPIDLPRLVDSITETMGRATDALARVTALAAWPADPRLLAGVVRQLENPVFYTSSTKPFWIALFALAVEHGDPRGIAAFESLAARFDQILVVKYTDTTQTIAWFRRQLRAAAEALRACYPGDVILDPAARVATTQLATRLRAGQDRAHALHAEIQAQPDDDHAIQVYADLLQERGDPRGELVALQLSNRDPARVRSLLGAHAKAWLAPLTPHVELAACRFARGFPHEIHLDQRASSEALGRITGDPIWATVRRLHLNFADALPTALLQHPVMRLEYLGGVSSDALRELLAWDDVPYGALQVEGPGYGVAPWDVDLPALVAARGRLTRLRTLDLDARMLKPAELPLIRPLWKSWLGTQLERVVCGGGLELLGPWLAEIARADIALASLTVQSWRGGITVTRDANAKFSVLGVDVDQVDDRGRAFSYAMLIDALAPLRPRSITRLVIEGRAPRRAERVALDEACARFPKLERQIPT